MSDYDRADYYDCVDSSELLRHKSEDDAIEGYLDEIEREKWPERLRVYGFARATIDEASRARWSAAILEDLLERIDGDEFGDPEDATEPSPAMKVAARRFVDEVVSDYKVWSCEVCGSREIEVMPWVRKHCPHWLEAEEGER